MARHESRPRFERIGLGPVFVYEWITAARRWQGYALRSCFVMFLLGALVVMWNSADLPVQFPIRAMAQLGQSFYIGVAGTQLALVMLAAPAATAGAICLDRARGTLTHLLMTDLSNVEIVLGKLAARLVPVLCSAGVHDADDGALDLGRRRRSANALEGFRRLVRYGGARMLAGDAVLALGWQDSRGAPSHICGLALVALGRADAGHVVLVVRLVR